MLGSNLCPQTKNSGGMSRNAFVRPDKEMKLLNLACFLGSTLCENNTSVFTLLLKDEGLAMETTESTAFPGKHYT